MKKISNDESINNNKAQFINNKQDISLPTNHQELILLLDSLPTNKTDKRKKYRKLFLPNKYRAISLFSIFLIVLVAFNGRYRSAINSTVLDSHSHQSSSSKPEKLSIGNVQPVKTLIVKRVDSYQVSRAYTGEVVASRASELGFKRSDRLVRIVVNEGDGVEVGTPLAYLDTSDLKAQEKEILAERSQADAKLQEMLAGPRIETIAATKASTKNLSEQLELARKKKSRREELYANGAIALEQLDEALSEVNSLQARLDEVESRLEELQVGTRPEQLQAQRALINKLDANLERIKIEQEKSILRSPFSGTIAMRLIDEGTIVAPAQPILRLIENDTIEARIGIPATVADQLPPNSYHKLQIGQKTYSARVLSVLPELDTSTRTVTAVLSLDKSTGVKLLPGQIARLSLKKTVTSSGYWLPQTALVRRGRGLWSCYVLGEALESESPTSHETSIFRLQQRDVEVLYSEADRVFVDGTLNNGESLIVNGIHRLVPGQLVRVLP